MNVTNESDYFPDFNFSDYEFDESEGNRSVWVLSLVLYCLTCIVGVPGNALVIWFAGLKMKRTVNTVWFLNLAVADLLCCLSIPFALADVLLENHWPYGNAMCKILPTVIILNMFASIFTLSLIGLDRFLQVVKPVWAQNNRSLGLAWVCCGVVWALAFFLSLPNMILREVYTEEFFNITICTFSFASDNQEEHGLDGAVEPYKALTVSRFFLGFWIPLLSLTLCYALITRKLRNSHFSTGRAFRIMLAVVVAFFLSWLPYHVVGLMEAYGGDQVIQLVRTIDPLAISLAYINSCMNPVLYVFMGQDFKEKMKLSLRRVLERAFSEDGGQSTLNSKAQQSQATNTSDQHATITTLTEDRL